MPDEKNIKIMILILLQKITNADDQRCNHKYKVCWGIKIWWYIDIHPFHAFEANHSPLDLCWVKSMQLVYK